MTSPPLLPFTVITTWLPLGDFDPGPSETVCGSLDEARTFGRHMACCNGCLTVAVLQGDTVYNTYSHSDNKWRTLIRTPLDDLRDAELLADMKTAGERNRLRASAGGAQ